MIEEGVLCVDPDGKEATAAYEELLVDKYQSQWVVMFEEEVTKF